MASIREVRERISSVKSTQQITKAMKMVAAAKLRRATDAILQMRPYADKLNAILQNVSASLEGSEQTNKYAAKREVVKKVLIIPISSDRGLCGSFNTTVFKGTVALIQEKYSDADLTIMPIGKRADEYFRKRNYNVISKYAGIFGDLSFKKVKAAAEFAMNSFVEEKYDSVEIVYNEFKNVATQILRKQPYLPMVEAEESSDQNIDNSSSVDYIFEPSKEYIIKELIPTSLKVQLYKAVLDSNASEHGARMTAMDKATDNAGELLKELKLQYNRSRQAAITTEILEIVGGAEALAQGS